MSKSREDIKWYAYHAGIRQAKRLQEAGHDLEEVRSRDRRLLHKVGQFSNWYLRGKIEAASALISIEKEGQREQVHA